MPRPPPLTPPHPPPPTVDVPCSTSLLAMLLLRRKSSASASSSSPSSISARSSSSSSSSSSSFRSAIDPHLPRKLRRKSSSLTPIASSPHSAASADRVPRTSSALSDPAWSSDERNCSGDLAASASPADDIHTRRSGAAPPPPPKQRSNSDAALHCFCAADTEWQLRQSGRKRSPLSRTTGCAADSFGGSGLAGVKSQALTLSAMQRVAAALKSGSAEERWEAAEEARMMTREDAIARITLAMLGVISPLVQMLEADAGTERQRTVILALLNLAVGNEMNKSEIVKAQAVPRMVALLRTATADVQDAAVMAFLSLSALDGNKAAMGASGAIGWLVRILSEGGGGGGAERRSKDALRALYNLSICAENVAAIEEAGGVPLLLAMVEDVEMSEKSLATLSNLAATEGGRGAIVRHREIAFAVLVDALRWAEAPKCQERAAYVLMMIGQHGGAAQRDAMAAAGAIAALLELALLGTPLAQKRAARALDCFRRSKLLYGPATGPGKQQQEMAESKGSLAAEGGGGGACGRSRWEERRVVEALVRQSLQRTMRRIVKRAADVDRPPALRCAAAASSSSLPY